MDTRELAEMIDELREMGGLPAVALSVILALVMTLLVQLTFLILGGIGMSRIGKRLSVPHAGLAFVPGLSGYVYGAIGDALKTPKQSNYRIHMMMLMTFEFGAQAVYYFFTLKHLAWVYGELMAGSETSTLVLLETFGMGNETIRITYTLISVLSYVLMFARCMCLFRILRIFRSRHTLAFLILSAFMPEAMLIYFFAMRNRPLNTALLDGPDIGGGESSRDRGDDD